MNAPEPEITVKLVTEVVSDYFGLTPREIVSFRRGQEVTWPRHVTVGLLARLTSYSMPRIARALGGRDHTTILNSRRRFEERIGTDPDAARQVDEIAKAVVEHAGVAATDAALAFTESELEQRTHELAQLDNAVEVAERRFASIRRSFEIIAAARAVARARTAVIVAEHTPGQGAARRELDRRLDELMRIAEGGHV